MIMFQPSPYASPIQLPYRVPPPGTPTAPISTPTPAPVGAPAPAILPLGGVSNLRPYTGPESAPLSSFSTAPITDSGPSSATSDMSHASTMTGSDHFTSGAMTSPSDSAPIATDSGGVSTLVLIAGALVVLWLVLKK